MFSSQAYLDKKTGVDDLDRFHYLQALVTEYQDTDKSGQVSTSTLLFSQPLQYEDNLSYWLLGFCFLLLGNWSSSPWAVAASICIVYITSSPVINYVLIFTQHLLHLEKARYSQLTSFRAVFVSMCKPGWRTTNYDVIICFCKNHNT